MIIRAEVNGYGSVISVDDERVESRKIFQTNPLRPVIIYLYIGSTGQRALNIKPFLTGFVFVK